MKECPSPTPEEIAALCEEIRAEWSEPERRRRSLFADPVGWEPPMMKSYAPRTRAKNYSDTGATAHFYER